MVVAVLALLVAAAAAAYSRGQRDAANRQATAAEAQVDVMQRQLAVMEKQSTGTPGHVPYVPPWTLQHHAGDTYMLTNGGTEPEFDVAVELPPHTAAPGTLAWDRVDPRSSTTFMAARTLATPHSDVVVSWAREPGGPKLTWKTALPPRPPRRTSFAMAS